MIHSDLPSLTEKRKINMKHMYNMYDKKNYVEQIEDLILAFDSKLVLENVYRLIKFNQEVWLNLYIKNEHKVEIEGQQWIWKIWAILRFERL